MSVADHLDRGEEVSEEETVYDKYVVGKERVLELLGVAFKEKFRIEVQIGNQAKLFFTDVIDHLPEPIQEVNDEGQLVTVEPDYIPLSYLNEMEYVLLRGVKPAIGNAHLKKIGDRKLLIRFFSGLNALEAEVDFQGFVQVRLENAVKIGFPEQFGVILKRRHFRFPIPLETKLALSATIKNTMVNRYSSPHVADICAGGLSFTHPFRSEVFKTDAVVNLVLRLPGAFYLKVDGFVRSNAPVTSKMVVQSKGKCHRDDSVCGVQFDLEDGAVEAKVGEIVAFLQAENIKDNVKEDPLEISSSLMFVDDPADAPPPREKEPPKEKKKAKEPLKKKPAAKKKGLFDGLIGGSGKSKKKAPPKPAPKAKAASKKKKSGKATQLDDLMNLKKKKSLF